MTRALIIESAGNLRGSERALLDLIKGTPAVEFAICCPGGTPLYSELKQRGFRTLPYFVSGLHQKSKWQRLLAVAGVIRACLKYWPDVIHLNQSGAYKVTLPAVIVLNRPMVANIRLFEEVAYLARQKSASLRLRGLIVGSSAVEMEVGRFSALATIPLHRIYDAYDPKPISDQGENWVENRIVCAGQVEPMKGQDILVGALGLLKDLEGGTECIFAGAGDSKFINELKATAAQQSISSIKWLGYVADVVALLRTCPVLAFPSHRETFGRVILEAWNAGAVPVVFAGSGGAAEIVAAAEGGILYDEQTPKALAEALRKALALNSEERNRLTKNGQAWTLKNCNPKNYGQAISTILSNAALSHRSARL
jgi:glycosyltransferase involved in cell wall biosynthesis